jgi:hypothetical protein
VKKELGFEGIKGGEKGKEGAFFFWAEKEWLMRERRLSDFLVGVGKPQHIVSGSSALEAS